MTSERAHSGNWKCPLPECAFVAESDLTENQAYQAFVMHLKYIHGIPRSVDSVFENFDPKTKGYKVDNGVPISILARVEIELDNYIKKAMEWPRIPDPGPWNTSQDTERQLRDELEKAKATAAGRGLAIAIWHMRGAESVSNPFKNPDAVIRDAVERYQTPVPEDSHMGVSPSEEAAKAAQKTAQAPKKAAVTLTAEQREKIKFALENNFDPENLVKMFKVSMEEIEACR